VGGWLIVVERFNWLFVVVGPDGFGRLIRNVLLGGWLVEEV
jgi:hypothetical protein